MKHMRLQYLMGYIAAICFLHTEAAMSQTINITLDSAIREALSHNHQLKVAGLEEKIAYANYAKTDAVFLPGITATYTAFITNDPLSSFGFKLEQRAVTANDFDPLLLNHPDGTVNFNAKLELKQPIINPDLWLARKAAKMQTGLYGYTATRTRQYVVFQVQQAYLQLQLAYDAEHALEQALSTAHAGLKFADDHYQQGLIQRSDVLNAGVQVSTIETDLAKAKSDISNASDQLSLLIGMPQGVIYHIEGELHFDAQLPTLTTVPGTRPDLLAMQKAVEASSMMLRSAKMNFLPKLNAFGNFQYNDNRLAGFGASSYFAGLQLSWDVFKGSRARGDVAAKKFENQKITEQLALQKEQAQFELNKARRDFADAATAIGKHRAAEAQADEALRVLKNRYEQDLVNTTDLLSAQTQLAQRRLALAQAHFIQNLTLAYIQLLTSTQNPE